MSEEQATKPHAFLELPTGKQHISFSELRDWQDCTYRHKLKYVNKIDLSRPGHAMDFGTAVHAACESYVKTRTMNTQIMHDTLEALWASRKDAYPEYTFELLMSYKTEGEAILAEVPKFLDDNFPGWECIDAEHQLYEPIGEKKEHAFKGFIDAVIRTKKGQKEIVWLLDWKTTSFGWLASKKSDPNIQAQLVYYKNYWASKTGVEQKDIRCGFVLLKRTAKQGNKCELLKVSVGPVTVQRSLKVVNNMLASVKRGIAIKNRASCLYCPYKGTPHCT